MRRLRWLRRYLALSFRRRARSITVAPLWRRSEAGERDRLASRFRARREHNILEPLWIRLREILAKMGAAAFGANKRAPRDQLRDRDEVHQIQRRIQGWQAV